MLKNSRAVIFDFGGVIQALRDREIQVYASRVFGLGLAMVSEYWRTYIAEVQLGRISEADFLQGLHKKAKYPRIVSPEEIFLAPFKEQSWLYTEVVDVLNSLQESSVPLALLSNTVPSHARMNRDRNNFRWFGDAVYLSYEIGHVKPSISSYRHVLSALERHASSVILIDDDLKNIHEAANLGMGGIHYDAARMPVFRLMEKLSLAGIGVDY